MPKSPRVAPRSRSLFFRLGHPLFRVLTACLTLPTKPTSQKKISSSRHRPRSWDFHWHRSGRKKRRIAAPPSVTESILPAPITQGLHGLSSMLSWFWYQAPLIVVVYVVVSCITVGSYLGYVFILRDLPSPQELRTHTPIVTTKIYDRNGTLLYKIYKDENRSITTLTQLPQHMIDATISIEDKEFFTHHGVSLRGLGRVVRLFFQERRIQGGSTITQQLIKNTLLSPERTLTRKAKEILLALQVERVMTKQEILEMYFNEVSFGGSLYGIEEAAKAYFGKSAKDLTLAESAYLAGLPAAPSAYSAFGTQPELGIARQHEVLRRMVEDGKISPIQAEQATGETLVFQPARNDIKAPHFVMYIRDLLARTYGEEAVSQGGLEVLTSLDLPLQEKTQQIVTTEVEKLKSLRVGNGAALVTQPKTGEILAMVGSRNYFDAARDGQVNVTIRPRQPGSSIKPLTYAVAFERGMTPATILADTPITYSVPGAKPYTPRNYDGSYHGNVTIRTALANSYNIPAVKTLASVGVESVVAKGKQLGISTWNDSSRFGLSLTLGGGEVLMTDMAQLYGTFANLGTTVPLNPILRIRTYKGEVIYENPCFQATTPCGGKRAMDPRIAYQITNILTDNTARSAAFGQNSVLHIPGQEVAVKTGTTNGLRDNWTFGYTQDRLVAVWVGNNDNSQMSRVTSGITGASPIWNTIMKSLLPTTAHRFPIPDNVTAIKLCGKSGRPACGSCPGAFTEYFLPGTEPTQSCTDTTDDATADKPLRDGRVGRRDQLLEGIATE